MSDRSGVDVVGFDLDDTLYDHRQYVTAGFAAVAAEVETQTGIDIYEDLVSAYFEDEEYHRTFDVVLESHGLSTEMVDDLVIKYHNVVGNLSLYPEVPSVLATLAEQCALGLITDGKNAAEKLERLGLSERFEFVLATEHRNFSKQDPTPFRELLDHFETEPSHTVYVGNDPRVDFRQPNRLGMHTVRLRRGTLASMGAPDEDSVPDHVIDELDTLPDIVCRLND
jgi:putative hydrolase of the HAD superfamily